MFESRELSTPTTSFQTLLSCSAAFSEYWVGGGQSFDGKLFTLNFDMQSFVIAMAVNLGYISLDALETAHTEYGPILVLTDHAYIQNVTSQYYDLRYASMFPVMCIGNLTRASTKYMTPLCMLEISLTFILYAVPIFNSGGILSGDSRVGYTSCSCSQDNSMFDDI